ncbi:MAG: mechanosensitive ion channel family protein [Brachymonas sp.]|nr:mechanosensitive ion channel family protein [Brachymonas sp.]
MSSYFQLSSAFHVWAVQLGVIVLATLCCNFALLRVLGFLCRVAPASPWKNALLQAARLPVSLLLWLLGALAAVALLRAVIPAQLLSHLREVRGVSLIVIAALFAIRLIGHMERQLLNPQSDGQPVDPTTVRAIGKLLRLVAFATAALMGLQTLGASVSGVLAFGGVGAMAIGFAAKDMLANFFGGLMIYWDRPFSVGDRICSPDRKIDGTVEDIGWRITRLRTADKRPLYVPNSLFTNIVVENPSRMSHRRIDQTVGIRYDDAAKMRPICDAVRQMLRQHPDIDQAQKIVVHFDAYSASSLDFIVACFTQVTDWEEFHAVKQDVMLKIMDIVAAHGAEFAFPTQTLYLDKGEGNAAPAPMPAPAPASPAAPSAQGPAASGAAQ